MMTMMLKKASGAVDSVGHFVMDGVSIHFGEHSKAVVWYLILMNVGWVWLLAADWKLAITLSLVLAIPSLICSIALCFGRGKKWMTADILGQMAQDKPLLLGKLGTVYASYAVACWAVLLYGLSMR